MTAIPVTAPCSVVTPAPMEAARAKVATATRTLYGQAGRLAILTFGLRSYMPVFSLRYMETEDLL